MKNKSIISLILALLVVTSCERIELSISKNPHQLTADDIEVGLFMNSAQLSFNDFFLGVSSLTQDVVRMEAMTSGATYDEAYKDSAFDEVWKIAFADLLPDLNVVIEVTNIEEKHIPIYSGIAKVMKAYTLITLVDLFGDVPYSEALKGPAYRSPKVDNQQDIYKEALELVEGAITDFSKPSPFVGDNDLYYAGDEGKWLKFANTIKLKYYLSTRLVDLDSGEEIRQLAEKVILNEEDDFVFRYGTKRSNPNSRHPYYNDHYEQFAGRYLSNYYMWSLDSEKGFVDPRLSYYFYRQFSAFASTNLLSLGCRPDVERPTHYVGDYPYCLASYTKGYWGRDHGNNDGIPPDGSTKTVVGVYPFGGKFDAENVKGVQNSGNDGGKGAGINPIMLSSFSNFMLAESALTLDFGDARSYLEQGIRSSIAKTTSFGQLDPAYSTNLAPSDSIINEYVAYVLHAYDNADDANKLDIIIKEYHIAAWGNGLEMYNAYRRTGYPSDMQPTRTMNSGNFTRSFLYPSTFMDLTSKTTQKRLSDQVFWDTNPASICH